MLRDMRILLRMGCVLFYTDTDSIIFLVAKDWRAAVSYTHLTLPTILLV